MRRLLHKLFRRHRFQPYELVYEAIPQTSSDGTPPALSNDPNAPKVWYVGYVCRCGEPGFMVGPIDV